MSFFSLPSTDASPIRSSCRTPSASIVKVWGIACTPNILDIGPVNPPSRHWSQVISARCAPGGPEIEQHDLTSQIVQCNALAIRCRDCKRWRHSGAGQFGLADKSQCALAIGISLGPHLHELLKAGFGGIILLQVRERLSIVVDRVWKVRVRLQRLGHFLMRAMEKLIFVLVACLSKKH